MRFVDLITNAFLVAATTVPRCSASVWVWNGVMLNVRIGVISASVASDLLGDLFHPFIADDSACVSLSVCVVYPADCAERPPLWLAATATTPAAPPPTSTAAATARRTRMDARPRPRLLRLIIDASLPGRR